MSWETPSGWRRISTIDAHTAGEPFRVILSGIPDLRGDSILDRRRWAREHLDHVRRGLMWEPRGHADMYGCIVTPPVTDGADFGVLFLHNEGYSTMCGHGIIAIAKVAVEAGLVPAAEPETTLRIDTPAGLVTARAQVARGVVGAVSFHNVPSFAVELDAEVELRDIGTIRYDLSFGGAFYAVVDAAAAGVDCSPSSALELIRRGREIKRAVASSREIRHPAAVDLGFLYGVIFVEPSPTSGVHSRNVCVFAEGEVDRSPTGTGVSSRLAILHARGELDLGERVVIESIIGSRFTGSIAEVTTVGAFEAIVPEVEGTAYITGRHEFVFDPADPLGDGFLVR
jgi:trans-L-3-hydroxyproline dehydratase